jgi:hypothetical protein
MISDSHSTDYEDCHLLESGITYSGLNASERQVPPFPGHKNTGNLPPDYMASHHR